MNGTMTTKEKWAPLPWHYENIVDVEEGLIIVNCVEDMFLLYIKMNKNINKKADVRWSMLAHILEWSKHWM